MLRAPSLSKPAAPLAATSTVATEAAAGRPADAPAEPVFNLHRLELSKPIKTHKGEMRVIEIRQPTAGDYIEVGRMPFDVRGEGENIRGQVDFKLAAQWLARLTDLDDILMRQIAAPDWVALVGRLNAILVNAGIDDVGN